jgi:hypothetical protein
MRNRLAVAVAVAVSVVAVGCGAAAKTSTVTVTEQAGSAGSSGGLDSAPSTPASTEQTGVTTDESGRDRQEVKVGDHATDDGLSFRVESLLAKSSVPTSAYSAPIKAGKGAKLWVAKVSFYNGTKLSVDPFCGQGGAVLIDSQDRNFDQVSDEINIDGNHVCSEGTQPGFRDTATLVFRAPASAKITSIAVWNADNNSPDYEGSSYIVFGR